MSIKQNKQSAEYYFEVAEKYRFKGDLNFAEAMYQKAAEAGHQQASIALEKLKEDIKKNYRTKSTEKAVLEAVKAVSKQQVQSNYLNKSKDANYYFNLAEEYRLKGDLNFASAMYQKAVEECNSDTDAALKANILAASNTINMSEIYNKMAEGLGSLNTNRGGIKGFKGFVGEEMQAAEATSIGKKTLVLNNNGPADLQYIGKNGHKYYQQVKIGYKPGQIDFSKYKGQTVVIDKGNPYYKQLRAEGSKYGVKVVEGNITNSEAKTLAELMQKETSITGAKTATIVPKVAAAHRAGVQSGIKGAQYGAGFSLGSNLVDVACGDKEVKEAAKDVAKDTAISYAAGYAAGAAGSAIAGTSVGAAAIGAASTATATVAGTTVGGAVIGAGTAASAAVASAGVAATSAAVGAIGSVGAAVGSAAVAATSGTVAGAAVASGVAATAAAGAAVGAAAVAAAPVVAVGAAIGVGYKLLKKIF